MYVCMLFLWQDIYHTTHQCFYSRRSLYLALFRLKDGSDGVNELEPWLRNVQVRIHIRVYFRGAPGGICLAPLIITYYMYTMYLRQFVIAPAKILVSDTQSPLETNPEINPAYDM